MTPRLTRLCVAGKLVQLHRQVESQAQGIPEVTPSCLIITVVVQKRRLQGSKQLVQRNQAEIRNGHVWRMAVTQTRKVPLGRKPGVQK